MPGPGMELIGEEEKKELLEVLDAGRLYRYGSADDPRFKAKVIKLEQEVAKRVGVPYAVAVNSGTSALLVALIGLGVGPGDEVIVPGYTFIASISSIIYARAVPILAEVDRTLNLDPADVETQDHAAHQGHHGRAYAWQSGAAGRVEKDCGRAQASAD